MLLAGTMVAGQAGDPSLLEDDYGIGRWTVEGSYRGDTVRGFMTVRPSAGGMCLIYNRTLRAAKNKVIRGSAVGGRDPKTGKFCEYIFESDGSHFINRYPDEEIGDVGTGHGEQTGTVMGEEYEGEITVERKGRDHFVYTVESNGRKDVELAFTRTTEQHPKKAKKQGAKP
jgi:hypothetical protein